ncbi:MAG: FxLYD domain-containing protein [Coriobacteriia bacterium]|nr:FxLYD domain-containing protein [Coriobacteriia bacterium]
MRLSRTVVLLLVVVALLGAVALYFLSNPNLIDRITNMTRSTQTVSSADEISQIAFAYASPPFVDDYGLMRVAGYVQNTSSSELRAAKISIQLFDEDGNKKERVDHIVGDIKPGERKPYDVSAGSIAGSREATISIAELEVYQ